MTLRRTVDLLAEGDRHRRDDTSGGYGLDLLFQRIGDTVTIDRMALYGTPPSVEPEVDGPESCWRPELGPGRIVVPWTEFHAAVEEYQRWHLTAFMDQAPWMLDSPLIQRWLAEAGIKEGQPPDPALTPESIQLREALQAEWYPPHPIDPQRGTRRWLAQAVWAARQGTRVSMRNVEYPVSTAIALARAGAHFDRSSPGQWVQPKLLGAIVGDLRIVTATKLSAAFNAPIDGDVVVSNQLRSLTLNGAKKVSITNEANLLTLRIGGIIPGDVVVEGEVQQGVEFTADVGGDARIGGLVGAPDDAVAVRGSRKRKRPAFSVHHSAWVAGDLIIDGVFQGDVALNGSVAGDLVLAPSARITGSLRLFSQLRVEGSIRILGRVGHNVEYYPKIIGVLEVPENLVGGEVRWLYLDPADRQSDNYTSIAARRRALRLWDHDPRPAHPPAPVPPSGTMPRPFYRYLGAYGPPHTAKAALQSFQSWEAGGMPPLGAEQREVLLAGILSSLGGALNTAAILERDHKLQPASPAAFMALRAACALRTIVTLDQPDQIWELALVAVWQAAESEWAVTYYADNNRNPDFDHDYFLQRRAVAMSLLEQAEQKLQAVATQHHRPVPDRSTYPAYQGLHWRIEDIATHEPVHLNEFTEAQQTGLATVDRHQDDLLAGRLSWAAIHQLDEALAIHHSKPTPPRP